MTATEQGSGRSGLVARVKAILIFPRREWPVIEAEAATVPGLYKSYILILAAIGPLAAMVGQLVFGLERMGVTARPSPINALIGAALMYAGSLVSIYLVALVINALAPTFGGQKNLVQALKVSAYSWTAAWLAAIFAIMPTLAILGVLGLYSFYLLFLGLPVLMKTPAEKALPYTGLVVVASLILSVVLASATTAVTMVGLLPSPGGTLSYRGQELDVDKAAKAVEEATAEIKAGAAIPRATGDELQTLLPMTFAGGFERTEVSNATTGVGGYTMAKAEGSYARADATLKLEVSDIGPAGALAGAFNIRSSKETADGYEKMGSENGRTTFEEYDRPSRSGAYSVLVGNRYMVEAKGDNITASELKDAVNAVDLARLEAMAKG